MKWHRNLTALGGLAVVAALWIAPGASAAIEVGSNCDSTELALSEGVVGTRNSPGNPLPAVIPSAGVITAWRHNSLDAPTLMVPLTENLKVLRPTSIAKQLLVVGESGEQLLHGVANSFPTRIPVHAGDLLGLSGKFGGNSATAYCHIPGAESIDVNPAQLAVGSTVMADFNRPELELPVVAIVEPDGDGDGYGDETQDHCPQLAAFQTACPAVGIDARSQVSKGSVLVQVATDVAAPVSISANATLGKGRSVPLPGAAATVTPGQIAAFTLEFPASLKAKLRSLPRKRSLPLSISVAATNVAGASNLKTLTVKLRGRRSPRHPHGPKPRR